MRGGCEPCHGNRSRSRDRPLSRFRPAGFHGDTYRCESNAGRGRSTHHQILTETQTLVCFFRPDWYLGGGAKSGRPIERRLPADLSCPNLRTHADQVQHSCCPTSTPVLNRFYSSIVLSLLSSIRIWGTPRGPIQQPDRSPSPCQSASTRDFRPLIPADDPRRLHGRLGA
jgi:hypothetical protein